MYKNPAPSKPYPQRQTRLTKLRESKRLTLEDIAKAADCNRSAVWKWESLLTEPKPEHRHAYARMLGIDVGRLGRIFYEDRKAD